MDLGPPPRTHYYFDALPEDNGEGVEDFRRIACRAARIIEGLANRQVGASRHFDLSDSPDRWARS